MFRNAPALPAAALSALALPALLLAAAALAAPVPVAPAAQSLRLRSAAGAKVDAVTVTALRDMLNVVPNDGSVFGKDVGPPAVADALRAAGAPAGQVTLGVDALLVRGGGRIVLIDTGLGPKVGGALMNSLAATGVAPEAVDTVLITHSHGDHVGGLVTAAGALAFPRATIRMSAAEWAWMQAKGNPGLVSAIRAKVRPFQPGETVAPGIVSVAIPGHTPGHAGFRIGTGSGALLDIGDTAHSSLLSLAHPEWLIGYDTDPAVGRRSRQAWLARLASEGTLVFSPHFPFPGFGRVVTRGAGYAWEPAPADVP